MGKTEVGLPAALAVALLAGCTTAVGTNSDDDDGALRSLRGAPRLSDREPSLGDPGPTPAACKAHPVNGVGTTWLDTSLETGGLRYLRCLSPGTDELAGR